MDNAIGIPLNCGTFVGGEVPTYNFNKPLIGSLDSNFSIQIIAQPIVRNTTSGSTSNVVTQDLENIVSSGVNTITDYIVNVNQFLPEYNEILITSQNSGILLAPNSSGIAVGVSAGSTILLASSISNSNIFSAINLTVNQTTGSVNSVFSNYVNGSLAKNCSDSVDTRLVNKDPSTAKNIFSTQNHSTQTYVRNSGCWTSDLDLTSISPWNSSSGATRAGTLISPRHIVFAAHFQINNGATIRFIDNDNNVVSRTMVSKLTHPAYSNNIYPDITIGVLDSDVPNSISFAKILPQNWVNYLPNLSELYTLPCLVLDQEEKALVSDLYSYSFTSAERMASFTVPKNSTRLLFYENIIMGDSGNPAFLIINDELVIITVWTSGGSGAGTNIAYFKNDINTMMSTLGGGYQLTEVDLSGFNYYS